MTDYSRDQLITALRKADAAGDTEAARAIARRIKAMEAPDYSKASPKDAQAALAQGRDRFVERTKGMTRAEMLQAGVKYVQDPRVKALTQKAKQRQAGIGDAVLNAAAGAAQGVASVTVDPIMDLSDATQKAVNSGLGYVGNALLSGVGFENAGRNWQASARDLNRQVDARMNLSEGIERLAPTPEWGGTERTVAQFGGALAVPFGKIAGPKPTKAPLLPPEAAGLIDDAEKAGIRVLTSDVKAPKTFAGKTAQAIGERIPYAGTGPVRQAQQAERVAAMQKLFTEHGINDVASLTDDGAKFIQGVSKDLAAKRVSEIKNLTAAKLSVIEKHSQGVVPTPNTLAALDAKIAELTARGTEPATEAANILRGLKPRLSGRNLSQMEAFRADELAAAFKNNDLPFAVRDIGEKAARSLYKPFTQDMAAFIKARGGQADLAKWAGANTRLSMMAGELKNGAIKRALNTAEMTPENVGQLLFSAKPSDVKRLYSGLTEAGRAKAQSAIIYRYAQKAGTGDALSAEKFLSALKGEGERIGIFFTKSEVAQIEGLRRVLDATRRASTAAAAPPTGVQNNIPIIAAVLADWLGSAGAALTSGAIAGGVARFYESAPVRNYLLKLGRTAPGSKAELAVAQRLAIAVEGVLAREVRAPANLNGPVGVRAASSDGKENQGEQ